jgi:hypothetical protein
MYKVMLDVESTVSTVGFPSVLYIVHTIYLDPLMEYISSHQAILTQQHSTQQFPFNTVNNNSFQRNKYSDKCEQDKKYFQQ